MVPRPAIVVDTSALMAIVQDEPLGSACAAALTTAASVALSAGTMAEALIVAAKRGIAPAMAKLIDGFGFEIVAVTPADARRVADAYARWGRGSHPAGLNFGDCFAYALARHRDEALLFVGNDFGRTDVRPALSAGG